MKITIESTALAKALKTAGRAIPAKSILPILECFYIEAKGKRIVITASNQEISVRVPVPVLSMDEEGVFAIPAKKFSEHISLLPDCPVTMETDGTTMTISWLKGKTSLPLMMHTDYPDIKEPENPKTMDMPAQELLEALNATIPVCFKDSTRPVLCGVHFDILEDRTRIVGTDTKSLTYYTVRCTTGAPDKFTIPMLAASLIKGSIQKESQTVRVSHDGHNALFNLGDIMIITKTIIGAYPSYMSVIPSSKTLHGDATIARESLIASLRRIAACSNTLKMKMTPLSIFLSAKNTDTASSTEEDCECTYNGEEMLIGVNPQRLLSIIENISAEQIVIGVADPKRPLVISVTEESRDERVSIIMPQMIS